MNRLIQLKQTTPIFLVAFGLSYFGLSPSQAVTPAPDGGYPGGNTAEGQAALFSLTTGGYNTAVGFLSLRSDTTNGFNTAVGAGTLLANTADNNTATGAGALLSNTTGERNTANGAFALFSNTTGSANTAIGDQALLNNTGPTSANTAVGDLALYNNTTGGSNTAIGDQALLNNTTGHDNTAIGDGALHNNTTGNFNTALGSVAGASVTTASNVICIGVGGENVDNSCYIGNILGQPSANGIPVLIGGANKLGTNASSKRFKENVKPMGKTSEALLALKPVTFQYKKEIDPAGTSQFGLVAEDVEKVNSDLVVHDKEGKPYSVRYDQVNAMLLNEFLKEHRKVEQLEARLAQQEKDFTARLKAQDAKIQQVNNNMELSKPAPRTVDNTP